MKIRLKIYLFEMYNLLLKVFQVFFQLYKTGIESFILLEIINYYSLLLCSSNLSQVKTILKEILLNAKRIFSLIKFKAWYDW